MSRAAIGVYGEELYEQVLPLHGPDPDGLAHDYVGALTSQAIEVDDLARDDAQGRPGWGAILDIDACPVKGLPWLSQIAGVSLRDRKLVERRRNLILNPSAEADLSGISPTGATLSRVANGLAVNGAYHLHAVRSGASLAEAIWVTPLVTLGAHAYTFGVDVLHADASLRLSIDWYALTFIGITYLSTELGALSTATGRRVMHATAPAAANRADVHVQMPGTTIGDTFDVDAALFEIGTTNGSYFDGSSSGAVWVGVPDSGESVLMATETDDEWGAYARDAIRRQGGQGRGTIDAILSAVEDTLKGTKSGRLLERVGGNAYALELITRPSETPDPDATLAAAMAQKPAGMSLTHTLTEGVIIDEGTRTIDTSTGTIDTATLTDVA